jgi:tRNA(Ile)-lysidine synthase
LSFTHIEACDALVREWHGQGPVSVPGGIAVRRSGDRVSITAAPRVE